MIYAQIKDDLVKNTIVLDDVSLTPVFSAGFDHFKRIDTLNPIPGIGWTYVNSVFTEPEIIVE